MNEADSGRRRSLLLRYGVAVASIALASGLKLLLDPHMTEQFPFLLLLGAVMIAAWIGGLGPGLVATVLGAVSADYLFLGPVGSLVGLFGVGFLPMVLFAVQGLLITSLAHELQVAGQRAEASRLAIQSHQEKLTERERELHDQVGRMIDTQEEERRRVAYEIHVGFTQIAAAAYRRLALFEEHHAPEAAEDRQELDDAIALVHRTVAEARRVIANLRPPPSTTSGWPPPYVCR